MRKHVFQKNLLFWQTCLIRLLKRRSQMRLFLILKMRISSWPIMAILSLLSVTVPVICMPTIPGKNRQEFQGYNIEKTQSIFALVIYVLGSNWVRK